MNMENNLIDKNDDGHSGKLRGEVEFSHVSFAYTSETATLKDINLVVYPGQTVAIVGQTGPERPPRPA